MASPSLHLETGANFAFRPGIDEQDHYNRVGILVAPEEGNVLATVREPSDVVAAIRVIDPGL